MPKEGFASCSPRSSELKSFMGNQSKQNCRGRDKSFQPLRDELALKLGIGAPNSRAYGNQSK